MWARLNLAGLTPTGLAAGLALDLRYAALMAAIRPWDRSRSPVVPPLPTASGGRDSAGYRCNERPSL